MADWIHPACTADALQPPTGIADACNGPWSFDYVESWTDRNTCGEDTSLPCETYKTCASWDRNAVGDGLDVLQTTSNEATTGSFTCPRSGCTFNMDAFCQSVVTNRYNALIPTIAAGVPTWALNAFGVTGVARQTGQQGPDPETHLTEHFFECDLTIIKFPTQKTQAKPVCGCAQYPAKTCTRTGTTVTLPGQTRPTSPGQPASPAQTRAFSTGPTCLTCDQMASNTDAGAQAKFDCLDHNVATATGNIHASLVARMKLLVQLTGELLTPAQRTRAEGIYDQDPVDGAVCNVPLVWDSACLTEATPLGLPSQLQLCQDLAKNDNTSIGAAGAELMHCLDQLAKVAQLSTSTCRLSTRDAADGAAQGLLGKVYPPLTGDLVPLLPAVLSRINAWWTAATTAAAGDRAWLLGHSNTLLRQLWTNIEKGKVPLPSGDLADDTAVTSLLADVTGTGFVDDFSVLSALYAPNQPATPPLLTLTGDALQPIADRLARLESLHDVACRFAGCRTILGTTVTLRSSAASELVHALSVLPDHDALAAALASATNLSRYQPELYAALTRIRDQHGYLDDAWTALGRIDRFAQLATISDPPAEASALAGIVRTAAVAWASYQASGEFVAWHRPRLTAATLEQAALVSFVDSLGSELDIERSNYATSRLNTVNDLLAESRQQGTIQSTVDRMAAVRDQDSDLISRTLGMETREADARSSLAGYQKTFEALVSSGVLDGNAAYQSQTITPIFASAADAHFPGGVAGDVVRDRIMAPITLHPGESLRLRVSGTWAPACAVLNAHIQGPASDFQPIAAPDAETGPEGYWVSLANDSFQSHATNTTHDWRSDFGVTAKVCYGSPLGKETGSSWEACAHADFDRIDTQGDTTAHGSDRRSTASFASGIRLPNTPFPEAPAGSLLAVVTPTGHAEQVLDVRVVLRDDLIVAAAPPDGLGNQVDVSLVVNDLGTCSNPSASALQIEGVKSVPIGSVALAVGSATAATLTAIEAQAPAILAQGQLTIDEAAALRAQAWTLVQQNLSAQGLGLAGLPYDLHQLFDGFLENEIASIARRSQMHAVARERAQLALTADGLAHELAFADAQDRLLLLIPRWRLRDLSGVSLANATDALSEALTTDVAQVFELRDPAAFTLFAAQVSSQTDLLIDVNLTAPYEASIDALGELAKAARKAVADAVFELPTSQRRTIVLAIPKVPQQCAGGPCPYGSWQSVSTTVARDFWSAMQRTPFQAGLTITPSDLYSTRGTGSLSCGDVAPVVRRIAMYLDTGDSAADLSAALSEVRGVAAMAGASVLFPRVGDVLSIEADSPDGVALALPALNGNAADVQSKFGSSPVELGTGAGLSPFAAFRFDMTPFQTGIPKVALAAASAVFVVFEVERRVSVANVDVVSVCQ